MAIKKYAILNNKINEVFKMVNCKYNPDNNPKTQKDAEKSIENLMKKEYTGENIASINWQC